MRRKLRPCLWALSPLLALLAASPAGLRVNHPQSLPPGIYFRLWKHPEKGDLVTFEPPSGPAFDLALARGYLGPGSFSHYEKLLKRLAAVEGDTVTIDGAGVVVNGKRLPNTVPLAVDPAGRPLPVCRLQDYRLRPNEVLVISDYSRLSFDSRYFGPIPRAQLRSVVRPIWRC